MELAQLGDDFDARRLAEAAVGDGHNVTVAPPETAAAAGVLSPATSAASRHWQLLLDDNAPAGLIIGRGPDQDALLRALQELARLDRPVLTTFPLFDSVLSFYEVDMARTESGAILLHFNPLVEPPVVRQVADWVAQGHPLLGRVEQLVCTRALRGRSREQVLWHFARDVELIGLIAGRINRIGAHAGSAAEERDYSALSVQMLGPAEIPVRWNVEPPSQTEGLVVTLVCAEGRISLSFDATDQLAHLVVADEDWPLELYDGAAHAVQRYVAAIESATSASTWPSALHAMELTDSIEISLRRGRMIDVHDQQLTEELAFKGTMAAVGCAVLTVLVPLLLIAGWLAGQFGIPIARFWPHLLVAMLSLFLGFQLLPKLLFGPSPTNRGGADPPDQQPRA